LLLIDKIFILKMAVVIEHEHPKHPEVLNVKQRQKFA